METKLGKQNDIEKFFNAQIATLRDHGTPEQVVEIIQCQRNSVLQKASKMIFGESNILFLPVIPRTFRSPYDLMAMVRKDSKVGCNYLNPTAISDVVKTPSQPYYIYDVEDGKTTCDKTPKLAEKIFKQQKRLPLTAAEAMALTTHTDVLSRHFVVATGSRYFRLDQAPIVCHDSDNRPRLDWVSVSRSYICWGSASCGSR